MRRIKSQGLLVLFIAFLSVNITQAQFVSDTMSLQKAHNIFSIKLDNSTYESLNLSLFLQFPEEVVYDDQEFISLQIKNSDASSDLKKLEFARVYLPSLCHEEMPSNELIYNFPMELWQKYLVEAGEVSLVLSGEPQGLKAWISLDYEKGKALSNVKQIIPLWQYDDSANSDYYLEKSINWPSDTYLSYIQIITSGRHQDDFDRKNAAHFYFLKLNGEELAKREVWRDDCGFNPIFPQGKDWYEPRANWCPGLKVNSFVHIIPAHFYKNDSLKFQMEFQKKKVEDSGIDYFITSAVLFILEKPTYKLNASLQEIMAPNLDIWHHRYNPICGNPILLLQNTGQDTLHSITLNYGYNFQSDNKYRWQGSLSYLEQELVYLPAPNWYFYEDQDVPQSFTAHISAVNEKEKAFVKSSKTSEMELAPIYAQNLMLKIQTDEGAADLSFEIYNNFGEVVFQENNFSKDSVYTFQLNLDYGCYEWMLSDFAQNGVKEKKEQSTLQIYNSKDNTLIKEYHGDFGHQLREQFMILR